MKTLNIKTVNILENFFNRRLIRMIGIIGFKNIKNKRTQHIEPENQRKHNKTEKCGYKMTSKQTNCSTSSH